MTAPSRALLLSFFLLLLLAATPIAHAGGAVPFLEGWQYRWGDSPREADGSFSWLHAAADDEWLDIGYPSNPPERNGRRNLWYRIRLPAVDARDPALFIYSIDLNAELFVGEELIYRWGEIGSDGSSRFLGWPWHLVELPLDGAGRQLSIRVSSDYHDIGLWGSILIGSRSELLSLVYARDAPRLAVAVVSLLIGLALLIAFAIQEPRLPMALYLGLATLSLVLRVVARTHVKQLVLDAPLLWVYLADAGMAMIAVFAALAIQQIIGEVYRKVMRVTCISVGGVFAASFAWSLTGLGPLRLFMSVNNVVVLVMLAMLFALSVSAARRGNSDATVVAIALGVVGALVAYSMLVVRGLLAWTDGIDYLIMFAFSLGLSGLIARRVLSLRRRVDEYAATLKTQSEQLRNANEELERKVEERTRELEEANRRLTDEKKVLQIVSITDSLTGIHNRMYALDRLRLALSQAHRYGEKLSIIMLDLDHFKDVNDTWGHQAGDDVLRRVADILKTTLRDSDLAGRYGGEEFLIILPKAAAADALLVAERVRNRIDDLRIRAGEHRLTVSAGVAEYSGQSDETLLLEADRNLYRAKQAGRNRVEGSPS